MTFDQHLKIVAGIHIVLGVLGLLAAGFIWLLLLGAGMASGEADAFFVTGTLGAVIGGFLALTALPGLIGGIGILNDKNWARILLLVVSAFLVFHVPLGTLAAIYTFWTLLRREASERFAGSGTAAAGPETGGARTAPRAGDSGTTPAAAPEADEGAGGVPRG